MAAEGGGLLQDGFCYAESLRGARLRAASVLPALLARKTLDRLATADWAALEARVKIPRRAVYAALVRSFCLSWWTKRLRLACSAGHVRTPESV